MNSHGCIYLARQATQSIFIHLLNKDECPVEGNRDIIFVWFWKSFLFLLPSLKHQIWMHIYTAKRAAMMISWHGNPFRIIGPLWWESLGHQSISLTNSSTTELCAFLTSTWLSRWTNVSCRWFETPWGSFDVTVIQSSHWSIGKAVHWRRSLCLCGNIQILPSHNVVGPLVSNIVNMTWKCGKLYSPIIFCSVITHG